MTYQEIVLLTQGKDIQMDPIEVYSIVRALRCPCKLLVFGLGNDSEFWHEINAGGTTVFLEDSQEWYERIKNLFPHIVSYKIDYQTRLEEWKELINRPDLLMLDLPDAIKDEWWDAIIVDGPAAFRRDLPGRMKSIFTASKVIKKGGEIFVHDALREAERAFCNRYLGEDRLVAAVKNLRCFVA